MALRQIMRLQSGFLKKENANQVMDLWYLSVNLKRALMKGFTLGCQLAEDYM